jgi:hypothetical protein
MKMVEPFFINEDMGQRRCGVKIAFSAKKIQRKCTSG